MISRSSQRVFLLLGNAVMAVLAGMFWLWPLPERTSVANPTPSFVVPLPAEQPQEAPLSVSRSFFRPFVADAPSSPVAEPEPPPAPVPAEPPEAPRTLRLVGLIDHGAASIAFVLIEGRQGIHRRVVGEEIDGWILESIGRRSIELRRGSETTLLTLDPKTEP